MTKEVQAPGTRFVAALPPTKMPYLTGMVILAGISSELGLCYRRTLSAIPQDLSSNGRRITTNRLGNALKGCSLIDHLFYNHSFGGGNPVVLHGLILILRPFTLVGLDKRIDEGEWFIQVVAQKRNSIRVVRRRVGAPHTLMCET